MLCLCRYPTEADVAFYANINGRKGSLRFLVEVVCFLVEVSARPTTVTLPSCGACRIRHACNEGGGPLWIATWLILPVVIRSSQRLSHACLSINLLL